MPNYLCFRCKEYNTTAKNSIYNHLCKKKKCQTCPDALEYTDNDIVKFSLIENIENKDMFLTILYNATKTTDEFIDELRDICKTKRRICNHCDEEFKKYTDLETHLLYCVGINNKENIFKEEDDDEEYLNLINEAKNKSKSQKNSTNNATNATTTTNAKSNTPGNTTNTTTTTNNTIHPSQLNSILASIPPLQNLISQATGQALGQTINQANGQTTTRTNEINNVVNNLNINITLPDKTVVTFSEKLDDNTDLNEKLDIFLNDLTEKYLKSLYGLN